MVGAELCAVCQALCTREGAACGEEEKEDEVDITSSPSHEVDIVTALFSQRFRCGPCSERTVRWKIDRKMFINELRRVLREQPANKNRNFVKQPFPSFALGNHHHLISTNEIF